ncbi:MAG: LysM peptidoglycan-binding domain-containing protein [Chloroflexi bacterium]|nr:LysM peptidoglycan-binding domain-containing protein [Chloroflexota bacterium]MBP7045396.1 LysM peptidoglycan-binding domain-containing protein [Chloroflexota bacterium]
MRREIVLGGFVVFFLALIGVAFSFSLRDYITGEPVSGQTVQDTPTAVALAQLPMLPADNLSVNTEPSVEATAVPPQPTGQPPDQPATEPATHTVQVGETMFRIAANFGVSVDDLAAANGVNDPSLVYVGQVLIIPGQLVAAPATDSELAATAVSPSPANPQPSQPTTLNGIPLNAIVVMPPNVLANARAIFAQGQQLGRNPHTFAKVGDSTIAIDHFLSRFDVGPYNLGDYAYLQRVIDYFPGSFGRDSASVRIGLHAWTVFDPIWADKSICTANETVIACEYRLHNPSIALIRLGANDVGAPTLYDENMRQIVQFSIDNGVIPVLGTKADRHEASNQNNDILRQIAADYQIPLWEFDPVAATLPGRGLDVDGVHMNTFYAHDYTQPEAFQRGHAMNNLTALMVLDAILTGVILPAAP